ncbi:potassium transporter Kup [Sphingomonas nostoxanthinifaciens]|uniref:potassium transporter Kup n=1 Tax=Sphingomonas nostoxanthinifaciens TaxID=2872652 RepID=UPI001CC1D0BF|nr:potassium transporter Kup [Sphingomonas nostoxanthinifaciens]UAK26164.1 potassium transporter Kup [Sphingomonas nostoxanthinifaciens]
MATSGLVVNESADPLEPAPGAEAHGHGKNTTTRLAVGAIGVVFGDIGTSPLYSLKEVFVGHHPLAVDRLHLFGVLSLIFWTLVLVVSIKYVVLIMRADNKGEGGSLALLALITRMSGSKRWTGPLVMLAVLATALFFGDCIITPAISVLSAVEGLTSVEPGFAPLVLPIAIVILIGLFLFQSRGTDAVGKLFGPLMALYFVCVAALGAWHIFDHPDILLALNPLWAARFFADDFRLAFLALGSVVLAVTGAEALYADMGHFGRRPISLAWVWIVFPALMLNYLGQSAFLLGHPGAANDPFFLMAPERLRLPLVILATCATVIASQAVITGAYSVVQQGVQLGLMPRLRIEHTSASAAGQIYVPLINWLLMVLVILLVLGFRNSTNLAAAYGIAVTGTMFITSCMLVVLTRSVWKWPIWATASIGALFMLVDGAYFASNLTKIPDGGWFPLLIGIIAFTLLTTWARGRQLMIARMQEAAMPVQVFVRSAVNSATRVPGTAVFMTSTTGGVPHALLHNLKHNKVLHERVVLLTVKIEDVPYVRNVKRVESEDLGQGFYRFILHYGFMEDADVPAALARTTECGPQFKMMDTSFFLARQTLIASSRPGMAIWREKLFAWMLRNAESAMEFFRLPHNRVVELGSQVEI